MADDADRFFVPPYVGVKGWVGARLDRADTDWIGLAILIEQGWASVAPARVRDGRWVRTAPAPPPPPRPQTDPKVAGEALQRTTKLCLALSEAALESQGKHATFRVRKKVFAYFLDNHHGDAIVAVCVKMGKAEGASLMKRDPERFYKPAYIGAKGWVGVRLDRRRVDWKDVAARIAASYLSVAPKSLAAKAPYSPR